MRVSPCIWSVRPIQGPHPGADVKGMSEPERLSNEALDDLLADVLAERPNAAVAATTPEGSFCEPPEGLDVGERQVLGTGSSMEFIPAQGRGAIIEAWLEANTTGYGLAVLPAEDDPERKALVHIIDQTHNHGVYVAVIAAAEGHSGAAMTAPVERVREKTKMGRIRKDNVSTIVGWDAGSVEMFGFQADEVMGRRSLDLIHEDDHDRAIDAYMAMLSEPGGARTARVRHLHKDGHYIWVDLSNRNLLDHPEECVLSDVVDVSEEMSAQEQLRAREQLLARLTEALPLGVIQLSAERDVVLTNHTFFRIMGVPEIEYEEDESVSFDDCVRTVLESDEELLEEALARVMEHGENSDTRLRVRRAGEMEVRLVEMTFRPLTDDHGMVSGTIACVEDVTERVRLQVELENRATRDDLTGTFNRASTMNALEELLSSNMHAKSGTALIFIDVDEFKQTNDQLGHAAGDEVLRAVADRAEAVVRHADIVGRLGGDEFLVVCPGMSDEASAMDIATRLRDEVAQPVSWEGRDISVKISVGVVWCEDCPVDAEWLVAEADRMMYESKRDGAGQPVGRPARLKMAS